MYVFIRAIEYFANFLEIMILVRVLMSWIPSASSSKIAEFVYMVTDPVIVPCQELIRRIVNTGPIDFSPILALFLVRMLTGIVLQIAYMLF